MTINNCKEKGKKCYIFYLADQWNFLVFLILFDINSFSLVTGMVSYANL